METSHSPSQSSVPPVGDDVVGVSAGPQVWRGRCYALIQEQQQRLVAVLLHAGLDGDEGAHGEGGRVSGAREVSCRFRDKLI